HLRLLYPRSAVDPARGRSLLAQGRGAAVTVLKIAFRNMLRNRRRSAMTALAVAVGTMTFLLFGAFLAFVFSSLETDAVRRGGHLTVFNSGYFLLPPRNPPGSPISPSL